MTSVASEPVVFSNRNTQFQRGRASDQALDQALNNDSPFGLMLEAAAPPADPAPRQSEQVKPSEKTAAAPADPKKADAPDAPEKGAAADTSEPADDKAGSEGKATTKDAATDGKTPVVEEALPEVPEADETAEDGSDTADAEAGAVQVQADVVQPQPAITAEAAIAAPAVAAPEAVVPAPAEGETDPDLVVKPVAAGAPAAKPADTPIDAPVTDAPELPVAAEVKDAQAIPEIKGKIEVKPTEQPAETSEQTADTEIQFNVPQQAKAEQVRPHVQPEEAKSQPAEAKPDAEAKQQAEPAQHKPAGAHTTVFDTDVPNTSLPQTHQQPAADVAALTANNPRAAALIAQNPVPVSGIAVEIAAQAKAGNNRFEIRLDPPELGRIDVRLDVDNDGNVKSRLVIDRADTYDLLRKDASTLERALQQAGLKTSDSGLEFTLRDQGSAQREAREQNQRHAERGIIPDTDVLPAEAASGYGRVLGLGSGVDIRI